jgi:hypothetical protein
MSCSVLLLSKSNRCKTKSAEKQSNSAPPSTWSGNAVNTWHASTALALWEWTKARQLSTGEEGWSGAAYKVEEGDGLECGGGARRRRQSSKAWVGSSGVVEAPGSDDDDRTEGDNGAPTNLVAWWHTLRNPPNSWVSVRGIVLYIGGTFLVSVILMWPTPKIVIFGVDHPNVVSTNDYWCCLC